MTEEMANRFPAIGEGNPISGKIDITAAMGLGNTYLAVDSSSHANSTRVSPLCLKSKPASRRALFDLLLARQIPIRVNDAPENRSAAFDVDARGDLFDHQVGIQPRHEMLHGMEFMLVAHGKRFG